MSAVRFILKDFTLAENSMISEIEDFSESCPQFRNSNNGLPVNAERKRDGARRPESKSEAAISDRKCLVHDQSRANA